MQPGESLRIAIEECRRLAVNDPVQRRHPLLTVQQQLNRAVTRSRISSDLDAFRSCDPDQQAPNWVPTVQRVHKPTHLLPVPYISPLERWQSETSVFDASEDVADFSYACPGLWFAAATAHENGQHDLSAETGPEGEFEGPTKRIFIETQLDPLS